MGTRFELVLVDDERGESALRAVGEEVLGAIVEIDARLSRFRADSLVAFIEREGRIRPVPLDAEMFAFFAACEEIRNESGGLFDVTRGGGNALRLDARASAVQITDSNAHLDFGGVAKGYALDVAVAILREQGVVDALLHGGTSAVAALGAPPGAVAWDVAIASLPWHRRLADVESLHIHMGETPMPRTAMPPTAIPPLALSLHDEFLCVSAPHGRVVDGRHHIVDPRTGETGECAALAAVIGPSGLACDAWTKPALLEQRRPARLPDSFTSIVIAAGARQTTSLPPLTSDP